MHIACSIFRLRIKESANFLIRKKNTLCQKVLNFEDDSNFKKNASKRVQEHTNVHRLVFC